MPTAISNFDSMDDMSDYAKAGLDMEKYLGFKKILEDAIKESDQPKEPPDTSNIMGVAWFSSRKTVCVIIKYDKYLETAGIDTDGKPIIGGPVAYIAAVYGEDEEKDMVECADWGAKFPLDLAVPIIDRFGGWLKPQKLAWRPREKTNSPLKFKLKYKGESETQDLREDSPF